MNEERPDLIVKFLSLPISVVKGAQVYYLSISTEPLANSACIIYSSRTAFPSIAFKSDNFRASYGFDMAMNQANEWVETIRK